MRFDVSRFPCSRAQAILIAPQMDYYLQSHMALVDKHWRSYGLKSWSVQQFEDKDPSGLYVQTTLHWRSIEDFQRAWDANIPELMNDLENYTETVPTRWIAKVLKQG